MKDQNSALIDRRDAIKRASMLLGYAIGGSALAGVMNGCAGNPALDWTPAFFTVDQARTISEMAEHLLPKSGTPGAKDVRVDRFIDAIMKDYFSAEGQQAFSKGLADFDADCRKTAGKPFADLAAAQRDEMFKKYETQSPSTAPTVWGAQTMENPPPTTFYRGFKELVLLGYFSSEEVGKNILKYDPIPGRFDGCVPLKDIGNSWSL